MTGYWERPEATAETMRDGWLVTGDLGRRDAEGFVTLDGRSKDLFISGGENVYPRQVEQVYEQHPAIRETSYGASAASGSRPSRCRAASCPSPSCPAPRAARSRSTA